MTESFTKAKKKHYDDNERERRYLWAVRASCRANPLASVIIEMDGMDQAKTVLPFLQETPKSLSKMHKIKNHVYGVLINGHQYHTFTHHDFWKGGSNATLTFLCEALKLLPTPWPPVLYLQLDNTCAENKNQIVFSFLALLVHRGIFEEVSQFV